MLFFSRNAELTTEKYPDIANFLKEHLDKLNKTLSKIESFILDCEVVAFDYENGKILPFQTLMTRKRKDVEADSIKVNNGKFMFATHQNILQNSTDKIDDRTSNRNSKISLFLNEAVSSSCEGLMVKTLNDNASYEPSKRSLFWLKLKKDYLGKSGDSFDLVPLGGFFGKGKRTGVFGAFLMGCYDESNDEFQAICKVGTGFSESDLKRLSEKLASKERPNAAKFYRLPDKSESSPDVWFEPAAVWEIRCADLSLSPKYFSAVGLVEERKGIALRFPRFLNEREDKKPEDATTALQVAEIYRSQFK